MFEQLILKLEDQKENKDKEVKFKIGECIKSLTRITETLNDRNKDYAKEFNQFFSFIEPWLKAETDPSLKATLLECKKELNIFHEKVLNSLHNEKTITFSAELIDYLGALLCTKDLVNLSSTCTFFRSSLQHELTKRKTEYLGIIQIVAAYSHTIFLRRDGTVWGCGLNDSGELGLGHTNNQLTPVQIPLFDVQQIATSGHHTVFLKKDGTVWGCGRNDSGELGLGHTNNQLTPVQIPLSDVQQIAAAGVHTVFLKRDGTVWGCGNNRGGLLGLGDTKKQSTPVQIPLLSDIQQIEASGLCTLFLKRDGTVWVCGLGLWPGLNNSRLTSPVQMPLLFDVQQIATSNGHTVFLKRDGTVWAYGTNRSGQLGLEYEIYHQTPVQISSLSNIQQIAVGGKHTIFLEKNGTVLGCGKNRSGQLGLGHSKNQLIPTKLQIGCNEPQSNNEKSIRQCAGN